MAARILRTIDPRTLKNRLNARNSHHALVIKDLDDMIVQSKQDRIDSKPAGTNNVGCALGKAFLQRSIS